MKWIAVLANFFFPGLGNLISGHKRALGAAWLVAMIGLTYVELSIQAPLPDVWKLMFASVFLLNTAFAVDLYQALSAPAPSRS